MTLVNNTIVANAGSGIGCINAKDVLLVGNMVSGNEVGVSVRPYDEGSLIREFSPLLEEDAGASSVSIRGNIIEDNVVDDWHVVEGCTVIELND